MTRSIPFLAAMVVLAGCGHGTTKTAANSATRTCPTTRGMTLGWKDIQPLQTGGRLTFVTRSANVAGRNYVVNGSVTNNSSAPVSIELYPADERPEYLIWPESFGIAYRQAANPGNIANRQLINFRATTFVPPLPETLNPGQTWRGRFCGYSRRLPSHHEWWVIYGDFTPGGHWITDKTFRTR